MVAFGRLSVLGLALGTLALSVSGLEDWQSCEKRDGGPGKTKEECDKVNHLPDHAAWNLLHAVVDGDGDKASALTEDYMPSVNCKPFPMLQHVFDNLPVALYLPDDKLGFFGDERFFWRGCTPLMLASAAAQPDVVEALLRLGADRELQFSDHPKLPFAKGWKAMDFVGKAVATCSTSSPDTSTDPPRFDPKIVANLNCGEKDKIARTVELLTNGVSMHDDL